jgi:hypothetical protein
VGRPPTPALVRRSSRSSDRSVLRVNSVALTVAGGFVLLAVVIHWGFQKVVEAVARTETTTAPSSSRMPTIAAQRTPTFDSALRIRDREIHINERAQDALSAQRQQYRAACWHPKAPAPGSLPDLGAALAVTLTFDANGQETRREITAVTGSADPTIFACARAQSLPRLTVPTQGMPATTEVGLAIP